MEDKVNNNEQKETDLEKFRLDHLLSKYISVWLWSILFGGTTGLTYTLINYESQEKWGVLAIALTFFTIVGISFLLISWHYLYLYLSKVIIPQFISHNFKDNKEFHEMSGRILRKAYLSMIQAGVFGLAAKLIPFIFSSFGMYR